MPTVAEPFFVSSARHNGIDENTRKFTLQINPPFKIPEKATAARAYVHSATVPYSFPNVVAGKNSLRIGIPKDADVGADTAQSTSLADRVPTPESIFDITITLPPGIYTLSTDDSSSLQRIINEAIQQKVATGLTDHDEGFFQSALHMEDADGNPNFLTLTPNFGLGRVDLTLNHDFTAVRWSHSDSTLDILGFAIDSRAEDAVRLPPLISVKDLGLTLNDDTVLRVPDADYTVPQLRDALNAAARRVGQDAHAGQGIHRLSTAFAGNRVLEIDSSNANMGILFPNNATEATFTRVPTTFDRSSRLPQGATAADAEVAVTLTRTGNTASVTNIAITNAGTYFQCGDVITLGLADNAIVPSPILTNSQLVVTAVVLEHTEDAGATAANGNIFFETFDVTVEAHTVLDSSDYAHNPAVGDIVHIPYGKYTFPTDSNGDCLVHNKRMLKFGEAGDVFDEANYSSTGNVNKHGQATGTSIGGLMQKGYTVSRLLGTQGPSKGFADSVAHPGGRYLPPNPWTATQSGSVLYTKNNEHSTDLADRELNVWRLDSQYGLKTFRAQNPAKIDKVTEVGITVTPLVKGGVTSLGRPAAGVLARFQLQGSPGSVMAFEPKSLIKQDCSRFISSGSAGVFNQLVFGLVDQHGDEITDLQGEEWSANIVVEYDLPEQN